MENIKKIRYICKALNSEKLDALMLNDESNISYFTGFYCEGSKLLLLKNGYSVFFIDPMNYALAELKLAEACINEIIPGNTLSDVIKYFKKNRINKIGLNTNNFTASEYLLLTKTRKAAEYLSAGHIVEDIRKKKSLTEIELLRFLARETVKIWKTVSKEIRVGMTERELASIVDVQIKSTGYNNSFPTIAAFGLNTAYPHAIPSDKVLDQKEHVLVDFGIKYKGYCSDLTRTYYKGRINRQIEDFHYYVRKAHDLAIERIRPGVSISRIAKEVNSFFLKNKVMEYVVHSLGHGVGLDVHEKPFLSERFDEHFSENMIVTIEPGLYNIGIGGVRLEDMILITDNGCEVLTK